MRAKLKVMHFKEEKYSLSGTLCGLGSRNRVTQIMSEVTCKRCRMVAKARKEWSEIGRRGVVTAPF